MISSPRTISQRSALLGGCFFSFLLSRLRSDLVVVLDRYLCNLAGGEGVGLGWVGIWGFLWDKGGGGE